MNKKVSVILLLVLLALPIAFAEVSISKTTPSYTKAGDLLEVTVYIDTDKWINSLDLHEFTPKGWIITGWDIGDYDKTDVIYETHDEVYRGQEWTLSHWRFNKRFIGTIIINYELTPDQAGTLETLTVWTYEGGFGDISTFVNVLPPTTVPPSFPEDKPIITIPGFTVDLTILAGVIIICGFVIAAIILILTGRKKIAEVRAKRGAGIVPVAIEDLRAFIKLGLKRGYTLREMVNALRAGNIETEAFNSIAKEEMIRRLDIEAKTKQTGMTTEYERKLKQIIKKLKR